jgi:hypothetical protein
MSGNSQSTYSIEYLIHVPQAGALLCAGIFVSGLIYETTIFDVHQIVMNSRVMLVLATGKFTTAEYEVGTALTTSSAIGRCKKLSVADITQRGG